MLPLRSSRAFQVGFIAGSLILAGLSNSQAKLGSTFRQCANLYGAPTGTIDVPGFLPNGVGFHRGEYSITCSFEDDVCVAMIVMRMAPNDPFAHEIAREDMTLFMEDSFGHTSWVYTSLGIEENSWRTYDLDTLCSYTATYHRSLRMLVMRIDE